MKSNNEAQWATYARNSRAPWTPGAEGTHTETDIVMMIDNKSQE